MVSLSSLAVALIFDLCIFLVLFISFLAYRKVRSKPIDLEIDNCEFKEPCMNEAKYSLIEISTMLL